MRTKTPLLLTAVLTAALMLTSIPIFGSAAPGNPALLRIDTKMTISGLSTMQGSGSAQLTYIGDAAADLRRHIFNGGFDSNGDQWLYLNETNTFLNAVSKALEGRVYWGITIESGTNFTDRPEAFTSARTSGLLNSQWNAENDIVFSISFHGKGEGSSKMIETAQGAYETFALAVGEVTHYNFTGVMTTTHRLTTFMLGSFTQPDLAAGGKVSALRTPIGEVLWYSFTGNVTTSVDVSDSVSYNSFSLMENQQISFVVLLIGIVLIMRMPGAKFDKYEKLHPRKFRKYAKPLMSVRVSSLVLASVLSALYLLPFAFSFVSREALFYAAYLYILVPAFIIVQHFFSKSIYDRAALSIPDESIIEVKQAAVVPQEGEGEILCKACYRPIDAGLELFQCNCGTTMHIECAEKAQSCPQCKEPLFPERTRSIQCKSCGETFLYSGTEDSYSIQCTKCGAFQEDIKPGRNYLIVDEDPRNAFMMMRAMQLSERPAMCLTTSFPGKIRADYDLGAMPIKWFSDSSTDIDNVNPKDLEGDSMEMVSTFLMTTKGAAVMIDGVETLIEMNGFDKVLAFIKRLNDLAAIHGSTIIVSLDKKSVPEEQAKKISDEFDEIHDFQ